MLWLSGQGKVQVKGVGQECPTHTDRYNADCLEAKCNSCEEEV